MTCYNAGAHLYTNEYATDIRAFLFALQSEESYHAEYAQITSDDLLCILDSGCSIAISPDITDFPDGIEPINDLELKGIASGLAVTGVGMAHWTFLNEFNERVTVKIECLLVPEIPVRLLPPQQLSMQDTSSNSNGAWIGSGLAAKVFYQGHMIKFPYDKQNYLPIAKLAPGSSKFQAYCSACDMPTKQAVAFNATTIPTSFEKQAQNDNLTSSQRTLLRIHHRRGHESMAKIQHMTRDGHYDLPIEITKCKIPQCRACDFGASKQRPHESHTGGLSKNNKIDQPGTFVSTDQMISGSPGLIPFTSGKPSARRYQLATL